MSKMTNNFKTVEIRKREMEVLKRPTETYYFISELRMSAILEELEDAEKQREGVSKCV